MKQEHLLYVVLSLVAFAGFAGFGKNSFSVSLREKISAPFSSAEHLHSGSGYSSHSSVSSSSYSSSSASSSSLSSPRSNIFEKTYSQVANFFGFEDGRAKSSYSLASNSSPDPSSGGGAGGRGGGGGGAGGGGGGAEESGKKSGSKGAGGSAASASKPSDEKGKGNAEEEDDDDDDDEKEDEDPALPGGNQPIPDPIKTASEEAKNNFTSESHLSVPFPNDLDYRPLDIEDGVSAIHGYNTNLQVNVSLMAKAGTYGPSELQGFLEEYGSAIPGFKSSIVENITESSAERPPAQNTSGLSSPYVWSMQMGSNTLTVALVQREDGQGTYLAILSGPTAYFDSNEDKYDAIYSQIKANP
ncbi:hypothetical protein [Bdellovibrio bacteriovorus]|uniref:hypothetical protein n=1 Tax=Bdellovibrio TaxID=958 RepID=UPI0035A83A24